MKPHESRYVAEFIGDVNLFEGKVASLSQGMAEIDWVGGGRFKSGAVPAGLSVGQPVWLGLRPEKIIISLHKQAVETNVISGKVDDVGYLGSTSHYHTKVATGQRVTALRANMAQSAEANIKWEDDVWLSWPADAGVIVTK